ncbi:MAG: hypothetical protein LBD21_10185 [Tannerellaceae bacterium]|nr:hypothetical protein [Tannerellaceae bacterium]
MTKSQAWVFAGEKKRHQPKSGTAAMLIFLRQSKLGFSPEKKKRHQPKSGTAAMLIFFRQPKLGFSPEKKTGAIPSLGTAPEKKYGTSPSLGGVGNGTHQTLMRNPGLFYRTAMIFFRFIVGRLHCAV